MASLKQLEANRNNAQHSSGPATDAGRAESAQNSFKTGMYAKALIIRGEKREDFDALTAEYYERYEPESPEERDWLDQVIRFTWQLRRYDLVEAQLWEHEMNKGTDGNTPLGEAFSNADQKFARLQRMVAATQRALKEAQQELDRLRKVRREENPPETVVHWFNIDSNGDRQINAKSTSSPQIGFVPSTHTRSPIPGPGHVLA